VKHLLALGIQARKDNKARLARLAEAEARNGFPVFEDILPIRELDKNPMDIEKLLTIDEGHEGLVQMVKELKKLVPVKLMKDRDTDNEANISTQTVIIEEEEEVLDYRESSPVD
jgi:hypothetical protein